MIDMGKGIHVAYMKAGADFLAYRMQRLFTKIETPEDIALHNDVLKEVLLIVSGKEQEFFKTLAEDMLYTKVNRKKRFFMRLASRVLNIGAETMRINIRRKRSDEEKAKSRARCEAILDNAVAAHNGAVLGIIPKHHQMRNSDGSLKENFIKD